MEEILDSRQGKMTVGEYEKEFSRLSKYAPEYVLTEKFKCGQFEEGLHESIKRYLTAVTSLQVVNFYQLVQAAIKIEKSEMKSQEKKKEKMFSRGGSTVGCFRISSWYLQTRNWGLFPMWEYRSCDCQLSARIGKL